MFLAPPSKRKTTRVDSKEGSEQKVTWNGGGCKPAVGSLISSPRLRLKRRALPDWHEEIKKAAETRNWEDVRRHVGLVQQLAGSYDSSGKGDGELGNSKSSLGSFLSSDNSQQSYGNRGVDVKTSFWTRLVKGRARSHDGFGLLGMDGDSRTPLHLLLKLCKDQSIILNVINLEPGAVSMKTSKGRLPLHFAVVHRHDWPIVAALIDAYPPGLSTLDSKKNSPLHYAMNISVRESSKSVPPRTYWMPIAGDDDGNYSYDDPVVQEVAIWQEEQIERWATVHWLLLSSATHPQSSLSVEGRQRPMLVEALLCAAPPPVISLLIGASVMNLPFENKVTVFAASTLYSCITRQYPLSILQSLASQLHVLVRGSSNKIDMRALRDETGLGLVSAQYISCCFVQPQHGLNQEWMLSEEFHDALDECIAAGKIIDDNPALLDWWAKMEFLISFCWASSISCNRSRRKKKESVDPSSHPKTQLLHSALANSDTPPTVIRLLLSFYPSSIAEPDQRSGALPLHVACMNREYIPRYFEQESNSLFSTGPAKSSLKIIVEADPSALKKRFEGRTALHLAIVSGKQFDAIQSLLTSDEISPRCRYEELTHRDPKTFLYPFQLAAAYTNKSDDDSFRWTCVARNKFSHGVWQGKSDREKASEILKVAEGDDLSRTDTVFRLLRLFPGAVRPNQVEILKIIPSPKTPEKVDCMEAEREAIAPGNIGIMTYLKHQATKNGSSASRQSTDSSSTTDDSSFVEASKLPRSPSKKAAPSSLTLLLSKGRKVSKRNEDFFDCDASVLSNYDVLSTLTSTLHTNKTGVKAAHGEDEQSISILSDGNEEGSDSSCDSSSFDGFAEDSGIPSIPSVDDDCEDGQASMKIVNEQGAMETSSVESSVCFQVRRRPRKSAKSPSDVTQPTPSVNDKETSSELRGTHVEPDTNDFENDIFTEEIQPMETEKEESPSIIRPGESPSRSSIAVNNFEKIKRQETLLGSFTAASDSEGLTFDTIREVNFPPSRSDIECKNTEGRLSMEHNNPEVHPLCFDKLQMKWVSSTTGTHNRLYTSKGPPERPTELSRHHLNPFIGRPPRLQKSRVASKKVSTRQLISCMFCDKGALEVLMIPCKHLCICRRCSKNRSSILQCPVCSSAVTDRMILLS